MNSKTNFVHTNERLCKGCNKCIFKCPTKANEAFWENEENIVHIKPGYCISCGECILICDHGARTYEDDTIRFFDDLEKGENVSVVVAPAMRSNFDNMEKIFGFLKSKGVNLIYDVSLGADLCTWAYVNTIKSNPSPTIIAQPCPTVVSYIEKFLPEALPYLSPVQSPVICISILLKKYLGLEDKIMFLSPCIGKKRECIDENTGNVLEYNVTFTNFIDYIEKHNVCLDDYDEATFDNDIGALGFSFPHPGGLSENVKLYLGDDIWTKEIEGIFNIDAYLKQYINDIKLGNPVPTVVDALNCEHGCNLGTGTKHTANFNHIDNMMYEGKKLVSREEADKVMEEFDKNLNVKDFIRKYNNRSSDYQTQTKVDLEPVFTALGKFTAEDKTINCFCCGYGNCFDFAYAMATGANHKNNCKHYLLNKFKQQIFTDELTGVKNRHSYSTDIDSIKESQPEYIGILFIDINKLKEINDTLGHSFGDELIVNCALLLKKIFGDFLYRIGGDEFVVLDTSVNKSTFEQKVSELRCLLDNNDEILLSIGVHSCTQNEDLLEMVDAAEQKMYIDKNLFYKNHPELNRRL